MIRGTHRAVFLAWVVAASFGWTLPSAAQLATLSWSAPYGCPDKTYVAERLRALQTKTARRDLTVRARVQSSPARGKTDHSDRSARARYVLRLVLHADDYHAERRLESTSCSSVTDAAIWLIAVALDPSLSVGAVATSGPPRTDEGPASTPTTPAPPELGPAPESPVSTAGPTPSPAASVATPSASSSASAQATVADPAEPLASPAAVAQSAGRSPWRVDWARLPRWWRAGVFGGVWSAALPAPQASVGARLGFGISVFYAELRGAAELPRTRPVSETTEVRLATQDLGLALCSQWGDRVRGGPCLTAAALRTTGSVQGPEASEQALPWGAAGVSLELGFRALGRLEFMLDTGVELPISARPRFTVEGVGEVAVAAPVSVYARVGLGFRSTDVAREQ